MAPRLCLDVQCGFSHSLILFCLSLWQISETLLSSPCPSGSVSDTTWAGKNSCAAPRMPPGLWSTMWGHCQCRSGQEQQRKGQAHHGSSPCRPSEPTSHLSVCAAQGGPKAGEMTPLCPPGTSTGASFLGKKKSGDMETNLSSPWHSNWFLVQSDLPLGPCWPPWFLAVL